MTKIALQAMKRVLEERQAELENRNRSRGALTIERSSDELDQIQDGQEREFAIGELDRNSSRLREVKRRLSASTQASLECAWIAKTTSTRSVLPPFHGLHRVSSAKRPPMGN